MLTVYLRREPTTDAEVIKAGAQFERWAYDVQVYRDEAALEPFARFSWSGVRPRKGCKRVTLNCFNWRAIWLDDLPMPKRAPAFITETIKGA